MAGQSYNRPTLVGSLIVLRPIRIDDAAGMFEALFDEESLRLTGTQESFTLDEVQSHCQKVQQADDRVDLAITLPGESLYIGEVVLNEIDWVNRSANFRIAMSGRRYFGKGYGTEATSLMIEYGIKVLGLHRIELEVYDFNPRARHVYEKVGFEVEGKRRDVLFRDGEYHSATVMSVLASS